MQRQYQVPVLHFGEMRRLLQKADRGLFAHSVTGPEDGGVTNGCEHFVIRARTW